MVLVDGTRRFRFRLRPLLVPPSEDGMFNRGSPIRTLYGDAVCYLGAGTALLLQLAHPAIARGVHEHSDYERRPVDRLIGTLFAVNTVVFGSRSAANMVGSTITGVHQHVTGEGYRALDPELLCWVNATLLGCAVSLFERTIRPFTVEERDQLAAESAQVGVVFGCPISRQPGTWDEFATYWDATLAGLRVNDAARAVARSLLAGKGLPLHGLWRPSLALSRAVTAATLPPGIRADYGLAWRRRDQAAAYTTLTLARTILPRLPEHWRRFGPELLRSNEA